MDRWVGGQMGTWVGGWDEWIGGMDGLVGSKRTGIILCLQSKRSFILSPIAVTRPQSQSLCPLVAETIPFLVQKL